MRKRTYTMKLISGFGLFGGLLAGTLVLVKAQHAITAQPVQTAQAQVQTDTAPQPWAQRFDQPTVQEVSGMVEYVEEEVEIIEPVELALANDEADIDFEDRALTYIDRGKLDLAFESLRKHLHHNEGSVEVLLTLGEVGRKIGENKIAEAALARAEALDPSRSIVAEEQARLHLSQSKLSKARKSAKRAIKLNRESSTAWNLLGRVEMGEYQFQRAELAFEHAVELDPTQAMLHNNMGLLYVKMKKADEAVEALETAVELFEDAAPHFVFNNLGLAHEMAGHSNEARDAFEEALLIKPFYARTKLNLQRVEKKLIAEEATAARTAALVPPAESDEDLGEYIAVPIGDLESPDDASSLSDDTEEDEELDAAEMTDEDVEELTDLPGDLDCIDC